jgi:hypothetical protein
VGAVGVLSGVWWKSETPKILPNLCKSLHMQLRMPLYLIDSNEVAFGRGTAFSSGASPMLTGQFSKNLFYPQEPS